MNNSVLSYTDTDDIVSISDRLKESNISIIKEMMYLAEGERKKGKSVVSLGVGIPHYRMPESLRSHAIKQLKDKPDIDAYTFFAGMPKLRQLIARKSEIALGIHTEEENIIVTPGSMAALLYSALAIINPGDEVILLSPYFPSYEQQIKLAGGKIIEIPLIVPENKTDTYHMDIEKIRKNITPKTKAIIINSPNNPAGCVYLEQELRELAEVLKDKKIYVVTDEVYDYLIYDYKRYFNIASIKELWPFVIRCCSFSKKFGMTGWRLGYMHTNKELVKQILKIHDNAIVCSPHIAQETVYAGLLNEPVEIHDYVHMLQTNRDIVCRHMDRLNDLFSYIRPEGAYYLFPKIKINMSSIDFCMKLLYETGVIVIPGIGFGKACKNNVRISFGGTPEEINEAFTRIESWWKINENSPF